MMHNSKFPSFFKVGESWLLTNSRIAQTVRRATNCPKQTDKPPGCAPPVAQTECPSAGANIPQNGWGFIAFSLCI